MKKKYKFLLGLFTLFVFSLIIVVSALLKMDDRWEQLSTDKNILNWISLAVFRVLIYALPALLIKLFFKSKINIVESYKIQFITYTIVKILWDILALEFIIGVDILGYIDTSIVVISLFLTLVLKKPTKVEVDLIPPHQ